MQTSAHALLFANSSSYKHYQMQGAIQNTGQWHSILGITNRVYDDKLHMGVTRHAEYINSKTARVFPTAETAVLKIRLKVHKRARRSDDY